MMAGPPPVRNLVVVGGGPAGTALLIAASRMGALERLARHGLAVVHGGSQLGAGDLARYAICGDSTAETFLTAVAPEAGPALHAYATHPAARAIAARLGPDGGAPVPLTEVAALLNALGADITRRVHDAGGAMLTGHTALSTQRRADGVWLTSVRAPDGGTRTLPSRNVVIASGGQQGTARLDQQSIAGDTLAALAGDRLMASGDLLTHEGPANLQQRLHGVKRPRIAVLGSSASALASCGRLLRLADALRLEPGAITLLHRRPLRVFYPSAAHAHADGYDDFGPADICPVSKFVYRLAGSRMEAGTLVRHALGIGGRTPDPRLRLHHLGAGDDATAAGLLRRATLVIHALGYQPRALPVLNQHGVRIPLASDAGQSLVDAMGRVRDATGRTLPGLFGIGLGAGFLPSGHLGGEPSFSGQANGLWLWQNDAGAMIVDQLGALPALRRSA